LSKKKKPLPVIYERIYRCKHCSREMDSQAWHAHPWCRFCLNERLEMNKIDLSQMKMVEIGKSGGGYVQWVPLDDPRPEWGKRE
jgi:hypothetical protein